ncbi:hypothetical protein O6H91_01G140700 [Diphasiastrum complanatum]|uniref:Uncharacterized protein n=1 Tax=Diphasiastrum complanatum TaxID=34168 RepID=A0ACC2EWQ0_DIPCM|nr:hypothetical protein O6H91_01G140700 [Diphasiastrum complanatum]
MLVSPPSTSCSLRAVSCLHIVLAQAVSRFLHLSEHDQGAACTPPSPFKMRSGCFCLLELIARLLLFSECTQGAFACWSSSLGSGSHSECCLDAFQPALGTSAFYATEFYAAAFYATVTSAFYATALYCWNVYPWIHCPRFCSSLILHLHHPSHSNKCRSEWPNMDAKDLFYKPMHFVQHAPGAIDP